MKNAYRVLAGLISLGVLVQAMTIALGWFTALKDMEDGLVIDKNTDFNTGQIMHSIVGLMVIPLLAIALLIVSFFGGVAGGVKWAAIVFGLVVLQVALAFAGWALPAIGALPGPTGGALLGGAGRAARPAAARPAPAPATEAKL